MNTRSILCLFWALALLPGATRAADDVDCGYTNPLQRQAASSSPPPVASPKASEAVGITFTQIKLHDLFKDPGREKIEKDFGPKIFKATKLRIEALTANDGKITNYRLFADGEVVQNLKITAEMSFSSPHDSKPQTLLEAFEHRRLNFKVTHMRDTRNPPTSLQLVGTSGASLYTLVAFIPSEELNRVETVPVATFWSDEPTSPSLKSP